MTKSDDNAPAFCAQTSLTIWLIEKVATFNERKLNIVWMEVTQNWQANTQNTFE